MNTFRHPAQPTPAGFSLVEMLTVIAVIGILAGVAIPRSTYFTQEAERVKNRENAHRVASICSAARAAGHDFVEGQSDVAAVVAAICAGHVLTEGSFAGSFFGLPEVAPVHQQGLVPFLEIRDGVLAYKPQ